MIEGFILGLMVGYVLFKKRPTRVKIFSAPSPPPAKDFVITERSKRVLGIYKGVKITDTIHLEDGRDFKFESIAVAQGPGLYLADDAHGRYVVVDKYLLYKEMGHETT